MSSLGQTSKLEWENLKPFVIGNVKDANKALSHIRIVLDLIAQHRDGVDLCATINHALVRELHLIEEANLPAHRMFDDLLTMNAFRR